MLCLKGNQNCCYFHSELLTSGTCSDQPFQLCANMLAQKIQKHTECQKNAFLDLQHCLSAPASYTTCSSLAPAIECLKAQTVTPPCQALLQSPMQGNSGQDSLTPAIEGLEFKLMAPAFQALCQQAGLDAQPMGCMTPAIESPKLCLVLPAKEAVMHHFGCCCTPACRFFPSFKCCCQVPVYRFSDKTTTNGQCSKHSGVHCSTGSS